MNKKLTATLVCLGALSLLCLTGCKQPQTQQTTPQATDGWVDIPIDNGGEGELFVPQQTTDGTNEETGNTTATVSPLDPEKDNTTTGNQETKPSVRPTLPPIIELPPDGVVVPETTTPTATTPGTTPPETTVPATTTPETTVPETTVPETTVEQTEPTLPTQKEDEGKTAFEIYNSLPGEQQAEFFASFSSPAEFFAWYNAAKADHESENPAIIIDGNSTIDLGELKDKYGKNGN